jgi:hypothetical protein
MRANKWSWAAVAAGVAALAGLLSLPAGAANLDQRTEFNFSDPVMVPGATLPAGTYVFELADTRSNRNVVRIYRKGDPEPIVTTIAVTKRRLDSKGDVVVTFAHTPPGTPPAVQSWFFPGRLAGHEFVYPEEQARRISEQTKTLVLSTDIESGRMEGWERATLRWVDPHGAHKPYVADE